MHYIRRENIQDRTPQPSIMNAEVCDMSPIPASGDTSPPAIKPDAPTIADDAPIALRPAFIASVVTDGNIKPHPVIAIHVHTS